MKHFIALNIGLFVILQWVVTLNGISHAFSVGSGGLEEHDAEVELQKQLFKNYNKDVLPPSKPIIVEFGAPIISVEELNARTQTLSMQLWLRLVWKDSRLTWDTQNFAGIDEIKLPDHKIWQPHIQLLNSAKLSEIDSKATSLVLLDSTGKVTWSPPASVATHCQVNLKHYPYDTHVCFLNFGSWMFHGYHIDVDLEANITEGQVIQGWNQAGEWEMLETWAQKTTAYYRGQKESHPKPYPDVTFYLKLRRQSPLYKVVTVCPLIATAFFILASFWITPTLYQMRVALNIVSFLALILIAFHLAAQIPAVGSNVPLIVTFCGILIILTAILTMTNILTASFIQSRRLYQSTPVWMTTIVQSSAIKWFGISTTTSFEQFSSQDEAAGAQNDKQSIIPKHPVMQNWVTFFQFVDRIAFLVCLIIISSIMIATAA